MLEVNTHEKLLKTVLDTERLYNVLKEKGYKGDQEGMIGIFIYSLGKTDAYVYDPRRVSDNNVMTEDEYFEILINQMNSVI